MPWLCSARGTRQLAADRARIAQSRRSASARDECLSWSGAELQTAQLLVPDADDAERCAEVSKYHTAYSPRPGPTPVRRQRRHLPSGTRSIAVDALPCPPPLDGMYTNYNVSCSFLPERPSPMSITESLPNLPPSVARHTLYVLTEALPPPITDIREERAARDEAAIAAVAELHPGNAIEARLAARVVAADAHAMDCLRLAGQSERLPEDGRRCRSQAATMMRAAQSGLHALRSCRPRAANQLPCLPRSSAPIRRHRSRGRPVRAPSSQTRLTHSQPRPSSGQAELRPVVSGAGEGDRHWHQPNSAGTRRRINTAVSSTEN